MKNLIVLAIALLPMTSFSSNDLNVQTDVQTEMSDRRKRKARRHKRKGCFNSRKKWSKKYYMS